MVFRYMNTDELTAAGLTPSEVELVIKRRRIRAMHEDGFSAREIANALGVSTQNVYQHLNKLGLKKEKAS